MSDEQELKRKLAERAGFTYREVGVYMGETLDTPIIQWDSPDGRRNIMLPDFPHSLDACFKWLVPEVDKNFKVQSIQFYYHKDGVECWVVTALECYVGSADKKEEALALCRAIEQLIDREVKDEHRTG